MTRLNDKIRNVERICNLYVGSNPGYRLKRNNQPHETTIECYGPHTRGDGEVTTVLMGKVRMAEGGVLFREVKVFVDDGNNSDFRDYLYDRGIKSTG